MRPSTRHVRALPLAGILATLAAILLMAGPARAAVGSITYTARVVHHNRQYVSVVNGTIDLASGDFAEVVQDSQALDWKRLPGGVVPAHAVLPDIWEVGAVSCQQLDGALPQFGSPLLRHFVVGHVLGGAEGIQKGSTYLSGQLVVQSADVAAERLEIVASFNGAALVITGKREQVDGRWLTRELAVLGPQSELYHYFVDSVSWSPEPPAVKPALPRFDPADYVTFPGGGAQPVAVRPVKDWLVFQAQLPNGRPLNLVFDSGAETMILDDLVLKVDAQLKPAGEATVAGAFGSRSMQLYQGFSFEVGGVRFHDLPVFGTPLTTLGYGANMRIHGIVGNEILQLCRLDIDLKAGQLRLMPAGGGQPPPGTAVPLTFINELPHIEAQVQQSGKALLLLDTGQRTALSVNLDYLDSHALGDGLVMDGFLGDITGGLMPRYKVETLDLSLAGVTCHERTVDAAMDGTYNYEGVPVAGSIGFPLLASHFGGMTFDYSRQTLYLRDPGQGLVFSGNPGAWDNPPAQLSWQLASAAPSENGEAGESAPASSPEAARQRRSAYSWADKPVNLSDPLGLVRKTKGSGAKAAPAAAAAEGSPPGNEPVPVETVPPSVSPAPAAESTAPRASLETWRARLGQAAAQLRAQLAGQVSRWLEAALQASHAAQGRHRSAAEEPGAPSADTASEPEGRELQHGQPKLEFR